MEAPWKRICTRYEFEGKNNVALRRKEKNMETKKLFDKYHARVVRAGILKSLLLSVIAGGLIMFIVGIISWAKEFSAFIGLGIGLGIIVLGTPIIYFIFFKPTTKAIIRLVDKLGLEERLITMYELEHDESYIAMVQREDAKAKLKTVNAKMMTFKLSRAVVISACVLAFLGLSMTTVAELSVLGIIPNLGEVGEIVNPVPPQIFDVIYEVNGNGYIIPVPSGDNPDAEGQGVIQKVKEGGSSNPVLAVENEGFYFAGWTWTDERGIQRSSATPLRQETDVKTNLTVTAIFEPVENVDDLLAGMDGEGTIESAPRDPKDSTEGGGPGPGGPGGEDGQPNPGDPGNNGINGMEETDNNTIIDGQTDYRSEFDYDGEMDDLNDEDELPPEIKDAIGDYFDRLR